MTALWMVKRRWRENRVYCRAILYNEHCSHTHHHMKFEVAMHEPHPCTKNKMNNHIPRCYINKFKENLAEVYLACTYLDCPRQIGWPPTRSWGRARCFSSVDPPSCTSPHPSTHCSSLVLARARTCHAHVDALGWSRSATATCFGTQCPPRCHTGTAVSPPPLSSAAAAPPQRHPGSRPGW